MSPISRREVLVFAALFERVELTLHSPRSRG